MVQRRTLAFSLILAAAGCLIGAFGLPLVHSEFRLQFPGWLPAMIAARVCAHLIEAGRIPVGDRYLWQVTRDLLAAREYVIGLTILLFSVMLPCAKIVAITFLAVGDDILSIRTQLIIARVLGTVGKWSMADVFVVGVIIVLFKADAHFAFSARPGIYCYAASTVLSSLALKVMSAPETE